MKRVAVIGGGASGVASALTLLENDPDVRVDVFEKYDSLGGMATSVWSKDGKQIYNNGVQGIHRAFVLTRTLVENAGFTLKPTALTCNFYNNELRKSWSNLEGTPQFAKDCRRFEGLCRMAQKNRVLFALVSVVKACRLRGISKAFIDQAVVPTLALFFGTGNQAANVPAAMGLAVFEVPRGASPITIFTLSRESFISVEEDTMMALPPLSEVYNVLQKTMEDSGRCTIHLGAEVDAGMVEDKKNRKAILTVQGQQHEFDAVILATQAEDALRVLPTKHKARGALKKAPYYTDVSITHRDTAHMEDHFGLTQAVTYYIHTRARLDFDMGFYLNRYQAHVGRDEAPLYQTLYLDLYKSTEKDKMEESATKAIDPDLVERRDTWRQVGHTTGHLIGCVASMRKKHGPVVYFAGSYLLVNSHETAIMTGIRAAQRVLGQRPGSFPENTFGEPGIGWREFANALG